MSGWNLTKKEIKRKEQEEDMKVGERVCRVKRVIRNAMCVWTSYLCSNIAVGPWPHA